MRYMELFEGGKEDLKRKYASLMAMFNDASTTPGEKENAKELMGRLTSKFKNLYPNSDITEPEDDGSSYNPFTVKTQTSDGSYARWNRQADDFLNSVMGGYMKSKRRHEDDVRSHGKAMDLSSMLDGKDIDGNPVQYSREEVMSKIKELRREKKYKKSNMVYGDDSYAQEEYRKYDYWINRLMQKWMPEEYAAKLRKQRDSARKAGEKVDAQQKAKRKALYKDVEDTGSLTTKTASKLNSKLAKKLSDALKGKPRISFYNGEKYRGGYQDNIFRQMIYFRTTDLRDALLKLSLEDRKQIKTIIDKIYTKSGEHFLTLAQKNKIYTAFKGINL